MPIINPPNVWTNATGDGDWSNTNNWSLLETPQLGQTIQIGSASSAPTVNVPNGYDADVGGNVANYGNIQVGSTGSSTYLTIEGDVQLTGGGTISLSDNPSNDIFSNTGGSVLENVDNTISGSGGIYSNSGRLSLVNDANGVIEGSGTNNALDINNILVTNDGLLEATGSAGLVLASVTLNQSGGGKLEANGGNVYLQANVDIIGGTLSAPKGLIESDGAGGTLDGSQTLPVTIASGTTFQVDNGDNIAITGSIVNHGVISLDATNSATDLIVNGATSLSGGGSVQLGDNASNRI